MSKNDKSSRAFSELINTKIEPIIQADWIYRIGAKGKLKKCFFVSTHSALYICKTTGLWKKVKIEEVYPWVDLDLLKETTDDTLVFQFNADIIHFKVEDASSWAIPTITYLNKFFPKNHKARIEIKKEIEQELIPPTSLFVDLFISSCISIDTRPDPRWCNIKRKQLRNDEALDLRDINCHPKIVAAMTRALSLVTNITDVVIGGFKLNSLYSLLAEVLQSNNTIIRIVICDQSKDTGFKKLMGSLGSKELRELKFKNVSFTTDMVKTMAEAEIGKDIETLIFSECGFNSEIMSEFFKRATSFKGLKTIVFSKDKIEWTDDILTNALRYASLAAVDSIILKNLGIDIFKALEIISTHKCEMKHLDLSKNHCNQLQSIDVVEQAQGLLTFSAVLESINLRNIKWNGSSLCQFLALHPFTSDVRCDFSYAKFSVPATNDILACLTKKPPINHIERIIWKKNPVSTKFFNYFSYSSVLKEAVFDSCTIIPGDMDTILPAISTFISSTKLAKLSFSYTLRCFKEKGITELEHALTNCSTLRTLNYSNNLIGDRGLFILRDILIQNESISNINFSGSNPLNPSNFLEFLTSINDLPSLCHVTKPKNDITFLLLKSNKSLENEINAEWKHLSENTAKNYEKKQLESSMFTASTFMSIESSSLFDTALEITPKVTWDLTVEVNYPNPAPEWSKLRKEFKFENITGVTKPVIFETTKVDQADLIDLTPL